MLMTRTQHENMVLFVVPGVLWLCFLAGSVLQVHYFVISDWDFSYYLTQPWRVGKGLGWNVPFADSITGDEFWSQHLTPLSALLAPFIVTFESPYTLSVIHATSAGLVAFLLPRLVRSIYRDCAPERDWLWTACIMLALFAFFRPFMVPWWRQTHFGTLVTPFVMWALICLHQRNFVGVWLCCLMVVLGQERASVAVFSVGMYAALLLRQWRLGVALCLVSTVWFFGATQIYLPAMRTKLGLSGYFFSSGIGPLALLPEKGLFLLTLLLFCVCLPLCGRKAFLAGLCAAPNIGLSLVAKDLSRFDLKGHYTDLPSMLLLASCIYGLLWLQERMSTQRYRQLSSAVAATYIVIILTTVHGWYTPYTTIVRLLASEQRPALDALNTDIQHLPPIPDTVTIYAQAGLGPRFSLHKHRFVATPQETDALKPCSIVIISLLVKPLYRAGVYEDIAQYRASLDARADLELVRDSGRLQIYATQDLATCQQDFANSLRAIPAR